MSVCTSYNIEFATPPTQERINELKFFLVDTMGVSNFFCETDNGEDILRPAELKNDEVQILDPDYEDVSGASLFQVHPDSTRYWKGYERGDFWHHYHLMRFFLAQKDVKSVYASTEEHLGEKVELADAEKLLNHFMATGYSRYESEGKSTTPNNPVHPDCFCNKPLMRTSNDDETLNFLCSGRFCKMPPVRITGDAAKKLLNTGELPAEFEEVQMDGISVWTQKESSS